MQQPYNPNKIEPAWQKKWEEEGLYRTKEPKENQDKFYALSMFPYPSGALHMGHVRNYVITDVIARYQRMKGNCVLHPMGWDAFGLPAENAAIDRGIDPGIWTQKNISQMKEQLNKLGLSVDWNREVTTCKEEYYKWTQYIFIQLHKLGLAYQKKSKVNWDPEDKTVLANEQVDAEGNSWRSGAKVEQRELNQWFLGITQYGHSLIEDLDNLKGWPDRVKTMQSNWIGKSKGAEITFTVEGNRSINIDVFTTRPDTIYGSTYLVIAPDHKLIDQLVDSSKLNEFHDFIKEYSCLTDIEKSSDKREKKGLFLGTYVLNPINNKKIPLWTADYVLAEYGTGAVMGVPAHDLRDFDFAKKYHLPIKHVIKSDLVTESIDNSKPYIEKGILFNSGSFDGLYFEEATKNIIKVGEQNGWAKQKVKYKLRDWLISRQRYWGCPIPIINCPKCGQIRVPENDLPVQLPTNIKFSGKGNSPLTQLKNWLNVKCPKCSLPAKRETDTMDTFMCSSWYFLRYTDPDNNDQPFSKELANRWLPVDHYVGGIEHAILHLLYARFLTKALNTADLLTHKEPFKKLLTQGMVQAQAYKNPKTKRYIKPELIKDLANPKDPNTNDCLVITYEKMSKSKYNGIDPSLVINKYGADTARMFILFKAPPEKDLEWEDSDVEGQYRFLQRIYKLFSEQSFRPNPDNKFMDINIHIEQPHSALSSQEKELIRYVNTAIFNITEDLNQLKFNTAISELMILTNKITECCSNTRHELYNSSISTLLLLLAPFSPHISEELWTKLGYTNSVHTQTWPLYDKQAMRKNDYDLVIQINGKVRGKLNVKKGLEKADIEKIAIDSEIASKWIKNVVIKRVIVVPDKLVNIVI